MAPERTVLADDEAISIIFSDATTLEWVDETGFDSWTLSVGDLALMRANAETVQPPGSNPVARRECGLPSSRWIEFDVPEPGEGIFHLVGGLANGVESGLDDGYGTWRVHQAGCR